MKKLILAALLLAAPLTAEAPKGAALPEWMAGTWMTEEGAKWADEVWTDPRGGVMLGLGRSGFGPELESWEMTQIRVKADGSMVYIARPEGKAPVEFTMVLVSEAAIEFANPAHDYPQRIRYSRQGKLLVAEISLLNGSRSMRWNYRPVIPPQD
ncbi:MAG: hypothetical protein C0515_10695 [Novosphingobium sp.]|nr:hypothetical protein [Novosphingobium sp.]MBX9645210.1 hypothetical protein [Novosphingobium sp.]